MKQGQLVHRVVAAFMENIENCAFDVGRSVQEVIFDYYFLILPSTHTLHRADHVSLRNLCPALAAGTLIVTAQSL